MKKAAIIQSNYIPWKGYFDVINSVDEFILYDTVQYTKQDWRNRNRIKTCDGWKWLTIPVSVPHSSVPIDTVRVANQRWTRDHWKRVQGSYSTAGYFRTLSPLFEDLYLGCTARRLSEINLRFIGAICDLLGIGTRISAARDYRLDSAAAPTERLVSLCRQVGATQYLSGPAARAYLDESLFRACDIDVRWMDYSGYPAYRQPFCPPFIHEVSIIDLLFSEGAPGARAHMLSFRDHSARPGRGHDKTTG